MVRVGIARLQIRKQSADRNCFGPTDVFAVGDDDLLLFHRIKEQRRPGAARDKCRWNAGWSLSQRNGIRQLAVLCGIGGRCGGTGFRQIIKLQTHDSFVSHFPLGQSRETCYRGGRDKESHQTQ